MKRYFSLVFLLSGFVTLPAYSQEESTQKLEMTEHLPIEDQRNYFGVRLLTLNGLTVSYAFRVGDHVLLGASLSTAEYQQGDKRHGGGSLEMGKYFAEAGTVNIDTQEFNTTVYFRSEGYRKWGPLFRGGIGIMRGTMTGRFYRYDADPAFIVIGDGKRLQETGPEQTMHFETPYTRVGFYQQFIWTPKSGLGGHILEVGASAAFVKDRPTMTIVRSDGSRNDLKIDSAIPVAEVAYSFTF